MKLITNFQKWTIKNKSNDHETKKIHIFNRCHIKQLSTLLKLYEILKTSQILFELSQFTHQYRTSTSLSRSNRKCERPTAFPFSSVAIKYLEWTIQRWWTYVNSFSIYVLAIKETESIHKPCIIFTHFFMFLLVIPTPRWLFIPLKEICKKL